MLQHAPTRGSLGPIALSLGALVIVGVTSACQGKNKVVLVCERATSWPTKVAIELDEEGSAATMLDPITLKPAPTNPFINAYFSPTIIRLGEQTEGNFWLLDRANGKLTRSNPREDYYCSTGRQF